MASWEPVFIFHRSSITQDIFFFESGIGRFKSKDYIDWCFHGHIFYLKVG